jgi:hypothetical protein
VRSVSEAAEEMVDPADLINVAVAQLRLEHCELPRFSTLNRMVNRVRATIHRRLFSRVMMKLQPQQVVQLDQLLKSSDEIDRNTLFPKNQGGA